MTYQSILLYSITFERWLYEGEEWGNRIWKRYRRIAAEKDRL